MEITILIGGDIYPAGLYQQFFMKGDAVSIFNDLLPEFKIADFSIINIEGPYINKPTPNWKFRLVFGVHENRVKGLTKSGISAVYLTNNHI